MVVSLNSRLESNKEEDQFRETHSPEEGACRREGEREREREREGESERARERESERARERESERETGSTG